MIKKVLQNLKGFSRWQRFALAALILVLGFTGFQIFRTVNRAAYWREHRDEPIAGWMRVGFVANSYHVPPQVLNQAIGLEPEARDRRPLSEIARSQNRTFEELKAELEKAIRDFRAGRPRSPEPPGGTP